MSRIGKKPIKVPSGVTVSIDPASRTVNIEGSKGKLTLVHRPEVVVEWHADEKSIECRLADGTVLDGSAARPGRGSSCGTNDSLYSVLWPPRNVPSMGASRSWISRPLHRVAALDPECHDCADAGR